jgi:hypothetical protein
MPDDDRLYEIMKSLRMTAAQLAALLPHGVDSADGFPGALIDGKPEETYKQRLAREKSEQGWRKVG